MGFIFPRLLYEPLCEAKARRGAVVNHRGAMGNRALGGTTGRGEHGMRAAQAEAAAAVEVVGAAVSVGAAEDAVEEAAGAEAVGTRASAGRH